MKTEPLSPEAAAALKERTGFQGNSLSRVRISASKPNFEVGSSTQLKLSFGKKTTTTGLWFLSTSTMHHKVKIDPMTVFWSFWLIRKIDVSIKKRQINTFTTQNLFSSEKPALDPSIAQKWTLSANDMDDDDVVCKWSVLTSVGHVAFVYYTHPAHCLLLHFSRIWWIQMHFWMLMIWRSLTRPPSRLPVEMTPKRKKKPAKTGDYLKLNNI